MANRKTVVLETKDQMKKAMKGPGGVSIIPSVDTFNLMLIPSEGDLIYSVTFEKLYDFVMED